MILLRILIPCLLMAISISAHAVELHWQTSGIEKLDYAAAADVDITGKLGDLTQINWNTDNPKVDGLIEKLKALPMPAAYMHYRMQLKPTRDHEAIRARMIGVPVSFKADSNDTNMSALRQQIEVLTNAIMLQGDFDLSGDSADLTFYRTPKERNILTSFFYLPRRSVAVGDYWSLPVKLIELGPGIFVENSAFYNRVTLTGLKHSAQGTLAQMQYLISENVEGYVERVANTSNGRPPFTLGTTIFGYGEFLVEQGHWLRQVWVLDYNGTGKAKLQKQSLFALELKN